MKKKILVGLLIVAAIVGGVRWTRVRSQAAQKPEIRTAKVERGDVINTVSATGTLQPLTTVDIKSRAGGTVEVLAVEVGTVVKPGQLIAKIDPTDTLANVRTARAEMDASQAKVGQARDNLRLAKLQNAAQIRQAEESLRAARVRLAQAQRQAKVQPDLTRTSIAQAQASYDSAQEALRQLEGATIPQARTSAQTSYDEAAAALASAEESLRMMEKATLPQNRAQAKSAYDQARANVEIAAKELTRQKELRAKGFVAQSAVDTAQNKYDLAVAQADSAKEKMATLEAEQSADLQTARLRVTQARASLANAKRRLDTVDQDNSAQIAAARARVQQAKAALESARTGAVQDDLKQDDVAAARAAVQQAEATLANARASSLQESVRAAEIRTASAQVASADARLQNANTQYEQTVISAPRAGVILKKYVEQGTIITSGTSAFSEGTSLVQLGDISRMFVDVLVDEADIASVEVGQQVDIGVDAYSGELFEGKVTRIDPQAETTQNVTTIKVTVEVDNPDARLKPGMNATCDFIVDRAQDALYVPSEAVNEDEQGEMTVKVLEGEKQVVRKVETGVTGGDSVEILSGLKEGETVITAIIEPVDKKGAAGQRSGGPGGGSRGGRMGGGAMRGMPR